MSKNVSVEDFVALQNLVGKYQWLVDSGDSEGWAALWTEDGAFVGGATEPFIGHEELKRVPAWVRDGWGGKLRHLTGSLYAEYGADENEAIVRYYNLVTTWNGEVPKLFTLSVSQMRLVRRAGEWKIAANDVTNLVPSREFGATE
jgi:hypothetical protein